MTPRRRRPSAAVIVAFCALAVAVVSPARAGSWLITSSAQIKPGAVSLGNLSARARTSLRGQRGPRGQRGFVGCPRRLLTSVAALLVGATFRVGPT